jgi:anti-sigma factor RsiW
MRCFDVQVELQAYVDGELSPERAALLERHLADCDGCRAELATEPAQLTARVMARVRPRPAALPAFRLRWSDFAISLAGAGLAFGAMLAWRHLASTSLAHLYHAQMVLRLEMLQLKVLLLMPRLVRAGAVTWGLVLVGCVLVTALALAVWERGTSPVWKLAL